MISEAAIADLKARNPCDQVAARWVKLRRKGKRMIGPCPLHSPDPAARDSTSFECDAEGWVCAVCADGGDVVKLVMKREAIDFPAAIEQLGGICEPSAERAAELEREQARRREQNEKSAASFREQERRAAFEIWHNGKEIAGSPAAAYLAARGIVELPDRVPLRYAPEIAYFHGEEDNEAGRKSPRVVYRGPAMLAAIVDTAGTFRAVHITWIDGDRPGNKALITDAEEVLPSKKVRGSKAGNIIRLAHMSL
jgi:DNA primase